MSVAERWTAPARSRVVLWRHGRTTWNREGRFQGQTDVDLDETGLAQAERAAALLAFLRPDLIVSSDLSRAAATAGALARVTGLAVQTDVDLRETYAGAWEGLLGAEIAARFPHEMSQWRSGDPYVRVGGGETRVEVGARIARATERAASRLLPGGLVVLATHGGAARLGIAALVGLPPERSTSIGVLSNCCWSLLSATPHGWQLVEHNAGTLPEPVTAEEG